MKHTTIPNNIMDMFKHVTIEQELRPDFFAGGLYLHGEQVGYIIAGPAGIAALHDCSPKPIRRSIRKGKKLVFIELQIEGDEAPTFTAMSYADFDNAMDKLGLDSVHDPLFVPLWMSTLAKANEVEGNYN